jgi:hypothetical protein
MALCCYALGVSLMRLSIMNNSYLLGLAASYEVNTFCE